MVVLLKPEIKYGSDRLGMLFGGSRNICFAEYGISSSLGERVVISFGMR